MHKTTATTPKFKVGDKVITPANLYKETKGTIIELDRIFQEVEPGTDIFVNDGMRHSERSIKSICLPYTFDGETLIVEYPEQDLGGAIIKAHKTESKFRTYAYVVKTPKILTGWIESKIKLQKPAKAEKPLLSLLDKHDYLSLLMPDARFTTSRSGSRASGRLVNYPAAFRAIVKYVDDFAKDGTYGQAMNNLLDENILSKLWPEWNQTPAAAPMPEVCEIKVGDRVKVPSRPDVGEGTVYAVKGKKVFANFGPTGRTRCDAHLVQKVSTSLS